MGAGSASSAAIPDEAARSADEDVLGRPPFAHAIANLIHGAPPEASFRLAIYGEWGEGKTSVLHMLAERLEALGDDVLWVPLSLTRTAEQLSATILRDLMRRLEVSDRRHTGLSAA